MGDSPSVQFPQPSSTELEIQQEQLSLLREAAAERSAFEPILLDQYGYKKIKNEDGTFSYALTDEQSAYNESLKKYNDLQLELGTAQAEKTKKALEGTLPVSEGTVQRKADEFRILKENAARAGNPIYGDTPETAFSLTTSGQQLLQSFNKTYKLAEDAERRGEVAQGFGNIATNVGSTAGGVSLTQPGVPNLGTGELLPQYTAALQPYQFQRSGEFQASGINAQTASQRQAGLMQMVGQLGGTALGYAYLRGGR